MAERMLNKFQKQERVLQLHKKGKTIREISKKAHMAFRDISKIIKAYEKKSRLGNIIENKLLTKITILKNCLQVIGPSNYS
jgi:lambda repressor-like predicted transcriptional regulator